jgi:hypothetical protein
MELKLVSFELAKLLEEAGFELYCEYSYTKFGGEVLNPNIAIEQPLYFPKHTKAPTLELAKKWMREKYEVFVDIHTDATSNPKFCYSIMQYNYNEGDIHWDNFIAPMQYSDLYREHEDALEAGLIKTCEILKERLKK